MSSLRGTLSNLVRNLSEENYDQSLAQYCYWLDVGTVYGHIGHDQVYNDAQQILRSDSVGHEWRLIHPTAHLFFRFVGDMESKIVPGDASEFHKQHCTRTLASCFDMIHHCPYLTSGSSPPLLTSMNLVAHYANLGFVEEALIRNYIIQPLIKITHPKLYDPQADALIILFKLAGATFENYVDPSVVDRCFELLKNHYLRGSVSYKLVQEVVGSRERGWEGLPPPPVFMTGIPKPTDTNQNDPAATPVPTSLGLPNGDLEPQIPQPPPLEPVTIPATDMIPGSPVTHSPSISIASLSDFTVADNSDDESPVGTPIDSNAQVQHETFYLEDGNVEVLCGNTLFRVHTSILSFHSPALRRMFAQTSLATADSPNGCPRILSSDTSTDFATLLKIIYLPGFPERGTVPDFTTFSSLLRITAKYEMPTVRSQLLEVVCDAYPETIEGLTPSKPLGERVFGRPTPHPNAVLSLFVQQQLISALPMTYYMAVRWGPDSLMDPRLAASARLPPNVLQAAIKGLIVLREMELKETHRLILGSMTSHPCSSPNCPSSKTAGPRESDAHRKVIDRITDSSLSGTKLLQVLSFSDICGGDHYGFCKRCVEGWECGHAEVRRKAWAALPVVFGLRG
ncbi:hypothetical protein BDM02DRAFT_3189167 [Thelephora ganbajun]|uniref:Uncharacterized protein n=1 Tax=Thelephora ganbajun TaxID=370292 RepID=A0ACB6Z9T5_THEGA|nr:hypothetical protein BDM02DRAFT_3189167 [Thelephora ganbajun]